MSCGNGSCRSLFFAKTVPGGTYPNVRGASVIRPYPAIDYSVHSRDRFRLREAWNTSPYVQGIKPRMGTFRVINNAGDVLSRVNYSCGGPNMISGTNHTKLLFSNNRDGGQSNKDCDGSGIPPSTCNVEYVYDSSDFTRFKRLQAVNRGYAGLGTDEGDYSSGGANNGAQVAWRHVRIY
jgi:hypothetical protein